MNLLRLLNSRGRRISHRVRLSVECLEDRWAPAILKVVPALDADYISTFATLNDALFHSGAGSIIQIEPGSSPGMATISSNENIQAIEGDPAFGGAAGLQASGSMIPSLTLDANNVILSNLFLGTVTINGRRTGETIRNSILSGADGGVIQTPTTGPAISFNGGDSIIGNTFVNGASVQLGNTTGDTTNTAAGDMVENNVFLAIRLPLGIDNETSGLVVTGNRFESGPIAPPIILTDDVGVLSGNIINNNADGAIPVSILDSGVADSVTTNLQISNNSITTGFNDCFDILHSSHFNTFKLSLTHNSLAGAGNGGLLIQGNQAGGSQDFGTINLSGNDFRVHGAGRPAIQLQNNGKLNTSTISAQGNIFSVANPQTEVDTSTSPGTIVDTSNPLTGGAANLTAMFQTFGGGPPTAAQHAALDGASATQQAQAAVRSMQAATVLVDGLFESLLGRAPGAEEVPWVNAVMSGMTEEQVIVDFLTSPEYYGRVGQGSFCPNGAWVQSLYMNLLKRQGSAGEINAWIGAVASSGLAAVANGIVNSPEFRSIQVQAMYGPTPVSIIPTPQLLRRFALATPAELMGWVNSGLDLLAMEAAFLATGEFAADG
jgi:hypothetical protein